MSYNFIGIAIATIILCFVFFISRKKARKIEEDMDENNFTIQKPKGSIILCKILTVITTIGYIILVILGIEDNLDHGDKSDATIWFFLGISPFWLVWPFLIYILKKWKIKIENEDVTFTPYFRKKKCFPLNHITRVKLIQGMYGKALSVYHEKKKLFTIEDACVGYSVFVSRLKKKKIFFE